MKFKLNPFLYFKEFCFCLMKIKEIFMSPPCHFTVFPIKRILNSISIGSILNIKIRLTLYTPSKIPCKSLLVTDMIQVRTITNSIVSFQSGSALYQCDTFTEDKYIEFYFTLDDRITLCVNIGAAKYWQLITTCTCVSLSE